MASSADTWRTFYAIGRFPDETPVLAAFTPKGRGRRRGWRCRSTDAKRMQCDYESAEAVHDVCRWIDADLKYPYHLTMNREEVLEHLATHWPSLVESPGWMAPDPLLPRSEAAERVLRHLELEYA